MYDVIIIGAGPAGLTAGIYAARKNLKTIILSKNIGGQSLLAHNIENYPGIKRIPGSELAQTTFDQAESLGVEVRRGALVGKISGQSSKRDSPDLRIVPGFEVAVRGGEVVEGRAVVLATGKIPMKMGIPGEKEFFNKGVSYCSTSDAKSFRAKAVVVVGGGNAGLAAAKDLAPYAKKITVLEFGARITGDEKTKAYLDKTGKVEFITDAAVKEIKGTTVVTSVVYSNRKTGEEGEIPCEGVFINVGQECSTKFLENFVKLNERKEIEIDFRNKTSVDGVFACGDATSVPYKHWVIAAGEGAKAALTAYDFLTGETY